MKQTRTSPRFRVTAAAIVAAAGLAACATAPRQRPAEPPFDLPYVLIGGSEASLARFEAAARACGAEVRSITLTHSRWVAIGMDRAPPPGDPGRACAMQWILDHPEEELGFVGNERRE